MGKARRLLLRLDAGWSGLELGVSLAVLALLVGSLLLWVALKGLSSRTTDAFIAGLVFRAATAGLVTGLLARWLEAGPRLAWGASLLAAASAWLWRDVGADAASNVLGWLQDGSLLTWVGGLRGLATRLTLWLALLGASMATASGRHVTVDVLTRGLGEGARRPLAALGGVVAAVVCLTAAWGFFDFTAIDAFGASSQARPAEKAAAVSEGLGRHLVWAGRQLRVDVTVAGRVLAGRPWSQSLTGAEWNALWSDEPECAALLEAEPSVLRSPLVSRPEEPSRGLLVKDMNLVVPFGLVMMALRFVVWLLRGAPVEAAHGPAEGGR